MQEVRLWKEPQALNQSQLAAHLSVERSSVPGILDLTGLEALHGCFPWHRIWKHIHGAESSLIVPYLHQLSASHRYRLDGDQLIERLKEPLMTFEELAAALGKRSDTLSKAIRQGREQLPFQTIILGPRTRRYRPLDVTLWKELGVALSLPKPINSAPSSDRQASNPAGRPHATALDPVFGCFQGR